MTIWLMDAKEVDKIETVLNREIDAETAEKIQAVDHVANSVTIDSHGVGNVDVKGPLTPDASPILDWFGFTYTSYRDIRNQVNTLEGDKTVNSIVLNINSPGGNIEGMYKTMNVLSSVSKPVKSIVDGTSASAAYMLASQTSPIESVDELSIIGSVGVVIDHYVDENEVSVTNTVSEKKRNNVTTPEGVRNEKAELDDIYNVIVEKIANGRNTTVETVNANYGQGAVMTARTALKNGMIDSIGFSNIENKNKTSGISGQKKDLKMETLAELKAQHPDLYALCHEAGVEAGKKEFKAFASGHIKLAEASGDDKRAMEDIAAMNDPREVECTIHHQSVAIKKAQIDAHDGEAPPPVGEGDSPIKGAHDGDDKKDAKEAQELFAKLGVEVE